MPGKKKIHPPQQQQRPGKESKMTPRPQSERTPETLKLRKKIALITGGDSGIGKAVAILFAQEGADIILSYLNEDEDAKDAKTRIEKYGRKCLLVKGDISTERACVRVVNKSVKEFGRIDILVNNAAIHYERKHLEDITSDQLLKTFSTNLFPMFWLTKAALGHMKNGSAIINTSSVTAYRGSPHLMDYAASKGAIVSFTRSLAINLAEKGIRVNGVAPGPIWTPLIVSSFKKERVAKHGSNVPLKRAGQPEEVAPAYLFLASKDASYITGQFIHPNGGEVINT